MLQHNHEPQGGHCTVRPAQTAEEALGLGLFAESEALTEEQQELGAMVAPEEQAADAIRYGGSSHHC